MIRNIKLYCKSSHFIFYTLYNDGEETTERKIVFKNLTPHAINLILANGNEVTIQAEPVSARVRTITKNPRVIDGVSVVDTIFDEVHDLPDQEEGINYIVSKLVRDACPDRDDLFYPTKLIRDALGRVIACEGLSR